MTKPTDDASYVRIMEMHHWDGIEMAKLADQRGDSDVVKAFATRIIDKQQKDLEELGRLQEAAEAGSSSSGYIAPFDGQHAQFHDGLGAQADDGELRDARGAAFDRAFIDMMIPHHQQAIDMSSPATKFKSSEVQNFPRFEPESDNSQRPCSPRFIEPFAQIGRLVLRADRDGRPLKGCIEAARIRGLRGSPFTQYHYLARIEQIAAFTPYGLLDVDCGEGLLTRYLTGVAKQIVGIDLSPTAIGHSAHRE